MFFQVLRFLRLPFVLLVIFTCFRFYLGVAGVPYAPRGNAMFSIVGLTFISCIYFGGLSGKVGGFDWKGVILIGLCLGIFSQILIFSATLLTYLLHLNTYFNHWDALNVKEGTVVPMAEAITRRLGAFLVAPVLSILMAFIGRGLGIFLVSEPPVKK